MKKVLCAVLIFTCVFCLTGCTEELQKEVDEATYAYPDSKDTLMTLEEFNQLVAGMTEQEVWDVIGGKCTQTGTVDIGMGDEYITISYGCNGDGITGANAVLTFQGGKLSTFGQFGLN